MPNMTWKFQKYRKNISVLYALKLTHTQTHTHKKWPRKAIYKEAMYKEDSSVLSTRGVSFTYWDFNFIWIPVCSFKYCKMCSCHWA